MLRRYNHSTAGTPNPSPSEKRSRADATLDEKLRRLGWRVLRISAETIMSNLPAAIAAVRKVNVAFTDA